ncbi:MAG: hypothetical protein HYR68_05935 [Burkholderiales bacterium]|nr:hypothetical protein [Burkholderiales bacterium]
MPGLVMAGGAAAAIAAATGAVAALAEAPAGDSACALQVPLHSKRLKERGSKKLESTRIFIKLAFFKNIVNDTKHVHCSIFHAKTDISGFDAADGF